MKPDIGHVYAILREWATVGKGKPKFYGQLSHDYQSRTGKWYEPHGSWDEPLGKINNLLATIGAPALSALVIQQQTDMPGDGFWGCASNVPSRPKKKEDREAEWFRIIHEIIEYNWPATLP